MFQAYMSLVVSKYHEPGIFTNNYEVPQPIKLNMFIQEESSH